MISETASFNTAALTGESKPDTKAKGETVLAGMINLNTVAQVKVTTAYTDSKLSKILELVQNATAQKAVSYTHLDVYKRQDEASDEESSAKVLRSARSTTLSARMGSTHPF